MKLGRKCECVEKLQRPYKFLYCDISFHIQPSIVFVHLPYLSLSEQQLVSELSVNPIPNVPASNKLQVCVYEKYEQHNPTLVSNSSLVSSVAVLSH